MLLKPIVKSSLIALAAGLAGLLVFYRCFFLSGFDLMPGDGDTKFNLVILEHWFRVAQGLEGWRSPNFFFPKEETLGYSDGLVLLAPPYIAARFAGLLPFHALQAMAMVWSLVGYAGMMLWLRGLLGLTLPAAVAGALAFAFGTQLYHALAIGHVQFLAVELLPWLACLILLWLRGIDANDRTAIGWGCAAMAGLAILMLTSFYTGWFLVLQSLILALLAAAVAVARFGIGPSAAGARAWIGSHWHHGAGMGSVLLLGLIPFLMVYVPVLHEGVNRDYDVVLRHLPTLSDLQSPQGNLLWQPVAEALMPWLVDARDELGKGLSWGLAALFLATLARLVVACRRGGYDRWLDLHPFALGLGLSVIVCWLLMIRVGEHSLWYGVYSAVPGGVAVRTAHRFNCVLAFSVVTVAAIGIDRLRKQPLLPLRVLAAALTLLIALEQANGLPNYLSHRTDFARIEQVPPPPAACRAFVLLPALLDPAWHRWTRQLDAVLVAQEVNLPTLNGESGNAPQGWTLFDPSDRAVYLKGLISWADRYSLWDGLCALEIDTGRWLTLDRARLLDQAAAASPGG